MNHTVFCSIGLVHLDVQAFHSGGPWHFFQTCHKSILYTKAKVMPCHANRNSIQEHSKTVLVRVQERIELVL